MKNGKNPTLHQKKVLKEHGFVPENWLIIKDLGDYMEVVSRVEIKKVRNSKCRTRKLYKNL